jgi:F420H(2)-dependent quinone reductase
MGHIRGMPVLLLTTVGRRTGKARVTPVVYIRDGKNYVIVAANNGAKEHPGWFWNLQGMPKTTIEVNDMTINVTAHQASTEEKGRLWPQLVERGPFFDGYQKKVKRNIPVIILETTDG